MEGGSGVAPLVPVQLGGRTGTASWNRLDDGYQVEPGGGPGVAPLFRLDGASLEAEGRSGAASHGRSDWLS